MITSPSLSFQCTRYTVTEMLLCLSSSFTIISPNKMEQTQSGNPPRKWPSALAKRASRGAGPSLSPSWTAPRPHLRSRAEPLPPSTPSCLYGERFSRCLALTFALNPRDAQPSASSISGGLTLRAVGRKSVSAIFCGSKEACLSASKVNSPLTSCQDGRHSQTRKPADQSLGCRQLF